MSDNNNSSAEGKELALDDERRVKSLSPAMLVAKRFARNRGAIAGLAIIVLMFLFSFAGPLFLPYGEDQVFTGEQISHKEYANISAARELQLTAYPSAAVSAADRAVVKSAVQSGADTFSSGDSVYYIEEAAEDVYNIKKYAPVGTVDEAGNLTVTASGFEAPDNLAQAVLQAQLNGETEFQLDTAIYHLSRSGRFTSVYAEYYLAAAGWYNIYPYSQGESFDGIFALSAFSAAKGGSFEYGGEIYTAVSEEGCTVIKNSRGENYALMTELTVQSAESGAFLGGDFIAQAAKAAASGVDSFTASNVDYAVENAGSRYKITAETASQVILIYDYPSWEHWLGTDANGMDILTRLMYGGRISLMIGFIVVLTEVIVGTVIGGCAGYFGGWLDDLLMRLVDIFNCIPTLPLYIILGAVMDGLKIDASSRIYYLMLILGIFSWTGVARLVRGQILSLREQEFMLAAEAAGLSVSRRIFRHLIPNVIPQLIVTATMGLGSIILTESTLSFFGLGVKYPYASWGNIINAVTNIHVMTNYLFVWIPAGLLILLTVLGFNFAGDGLRDAFDPRMKR